MFFRHRRQYRQAITSNKLAVRDYNDSKFCDFVAQRLNVMMFAKTFVYPDPMNKDLDALMSNDKRTDTNVTRHYWTERQFCLRDQDWIQGRKLWEVNHDE